MLGGAAAVHQFCRIGRLAMIGGLRRSRPGRAAVRADRRRDGDGRRPEQVGLRRSGMTARKCDELKAAYRVIYRQGHAVRGNDRRAGGEFSVGPARRSSPNSSAAASEASFRNAAARRRRRFAVMRGGRSSKTEDVSRPKRKAG